MRFKKEKKQGAGGALDLTPIVDVVFNLLIFFALSLNFAATSAGINIKLPKASSAEPLKTEQVNINLSRDGRISLNDKTISMGKLTETLSDNPEKDSLVIIRADNAVQHGRVVEMMDVVRGEGFSRLAIAVEPVQKGK
ncbi:MAG: ExbD/TolR family protein [Deltaproteobacteria bacterium]